jgi:hypothetical protein
VHRHAQRLHIVGACACGCGAARDTHRTARQQALPRAARAASRLQPTLCASPQRRTRTRARARTHTRTVRAAREVCQVELDLVPAVVQAHGHSADEGLHARRALVVGVWSGQGGTRKREGGAGRRHAREHAASAGSPPETLACCLGSAGRHFSCRSGLCQRLRRQATVGHWHTHALTW